MKRQCAQTFRNAGKLDEDEPMKVANSIANMDLKYAVLTSVNRDDLSDGGAGHFSDTIRAIKEKAPEVLSRH